MGSAGISVRCLYCFFCPYLNWLSCGKSINGRFSRFCFWSPPGRHGSVCKPLGVPVMNGPAGGYSARCSEQEPWRGVHVSRRPYNSNSLAGRAAGGRKGSAGGAFVFRKTGLQRSVFHPESARARESSSKVRGTTPCTPGTPPKRMTRVAPGRQTEAHCRQTRARSRAYVSVSV